MGREVVVLVIVAIAFSAFTLFEGLYFSHVPLVGHTVSGTIELYVAGNPTIEIHHPLNVTYNFAIGSAYTLDLNVSASGTDALTWVYTLEDLKHQIVVHQDVPFTPNVTFNATRWTNKLTVTATNSKGETGSKSVVFEVSVPNSAPLLGNISTRLYACEAQPFFYIFNATDPDEGELQISVSPSNPFFVFPDSFSGQPFVESNLFSAPLSKSEVGNHSLTLSVTDLQYSDSKSTNVTVIEINNIPWVEDVGVQTVYLQGGENAYLNEYVDVLDTEDGNASDGNVHFNVSFNGGPQLFNITSTGRMRYIPLAEHLGVHNITYCVNDTALPWIHPNISLCSVTGQSNTVCKNFTLTVTNVNRPPTIIDYYPTNLELSAMGTQTLEFNITTYDPDYTIPDARWYVDGNLFKYIQGDPVPDLAYAFPCGVAGMRTISANITDGLATDSVQWRINVTGVACPTARPPSGGGGGGGGGAFCIPQWGCGDWTVCQNAVRSLEIGILAGEDYRVISEECAANNLAENDCGFQIRECMDAKYCNTTRERPAKVQFCAYTSNPSCSDGIKNCHSGGCELLVDCGGPCSVCPSCSDGTQNQGELDVDCGGPCPFQCAPEIPLIEPSVLRTILLWLFWLLLLMLLLLLISRIVKLVKVHNEIKKERRIQSALSR